MYQIEEIMYSYDLPQHVKYLEQLGKRVFKPQAKIKHLKNQSL